MFNESMWTIIYEDFLIIITPISFSFLCCLSFLVLSFLTCSLYPFIHFLLKIFLWLDFSLQSFSFLVYAFMQNYILQEHCRKLKGYCTRATSLVEAFHDWYQIHSWVFCTTITSRGFKSETLTLYEQKCLFMLTNQTLHEPSTMTWLFSPFLTLFLICCLMHLILYFFILFHSFLCTVFLVLIFDHMTAHSLSIYVHQAVLNKSTSTHFKATMLSHTNLILKNTRNFHTILNVHWSFLNTP